VTEGEIPRPPDGNDPPSEGAAADSAAADIAAAHSAAAHSAAANRAASAAERTRPPHRWLPPVAVALAGVLLFLVYLRLSWTVAANSDGASNVLQAWDMLHGNLLLHGWLLGDVTFYTTELPQYMLIESVLGRHGDVIHAAAAMSYTLVVVLGALLAKGRATGREALARMLITAGIMLAPQVGNGVYVLESSPGHIGTAVPLLATWLVLDRAGRRWWVPPVVGAMLAWVLVADSVTLYAGIAPLAVACGARAYRHVVMERRPVASAWFELSLVAAAAAAIPVASAALAIIHGHQGFAPAPVDNTLASGTQLVQHASATFEGVLLLFSADFLGLHLGLTAAGAMLHVVGLGLAAWATWLGIQGYFRARDSRDLVVPVLAAAVIINLAAYTLSNLVFDAKSSREMAAVLPFAAVLAGRLLAARLMSARLLPALSMVLAGYLLILANSVVQPSLPTQNQQVADWLVAHHLRYGLGGYWQASSITVGSGARAEVRPVNLTHAVKGRATMSASRESQASWYDPRLHDATFLVLGPTRSPVTDFIGTVADMRAIFGPPAHLYHFGQVTVLTYNKNLLSGLSPGRPG
jgi:hypothetical protein